jgi:Asp-tRNA(Asn)/Glu-tRNA(Gln) amidotransferase B subunit
MVDEVLAQNPLNFLIGQVMRKTRGKADPAALTKLIQKKLRG